MGAKTRAERVPARAAQSFSESTFLGTVLDLQGNRTYFASAFRPSPYRTHRFSRRKRAGPLYRLFLKLRPMIFRAISSGKPSFRSMRISKVQERE